MLWCQYSFDSIAKLVDGSMLDDFRLYNLIALIQLSLKTVTIGHGI